MLPSRAHSQRVAPTMISAFRKKLTSWLMLGFLLLALLAIVVTGFGTGGVGGLPAPGTQAADTLAEVNGEEIKADELESELRNALRRAQQQNPGADVGQLIAAGAFEALLDQLIVGRLLYAFGEDQGLIVTERMVDQLIVSIPAFRNFAGQFDDSTYRTALAQQNITEPDFRRQLRNALMQQQLQVPIGIGARVPESVTVQYASLMLERRRGTIGVIPNEALSAGIAPSDQEIAQYYARNRARYQVPERRVLRYAIVGRDQLAAAARATDEEIGAHYRENQARYAGAETRNLQQIVLPSEAEASAFVGRAGAAGANFAAAARTLGRSAADINLAAQSRDQLAALTSPDIAGRAFGAAQGALIGPVRSLLGWHVIRIESINRATPRPLEAVRGEIAAEIERRKLEDALHGLVTRVEERVDQGASFDDIVRDERLTAVETPPLTTAGAAPGVQYQAPPELAAILRGAFQMDPDDPDPAFETLTPNERYAFVSVARTIPAAVPQLQQIAAQVRADVIRQRAWERARALADRIVAQINGGIPAARAFAAAGVRLPAPEAVNARRLDISQNAQIPQPLTMFFSVPARRARAFAAPNGAGWYIVHVDERIPGQASCPQGQSAEQNEGCRLIQQARAEFNGVAGNEYVDQFARQVQQGAAIERNEEAIARLRQRLIAETIAAE